MDITAVLQKAEANSGMITSDILKSELGWGPERSMFAISKLVKDGLYFVGIDVIGGKLVEVNVMSPGGITYMNKVYKIKLQEKVIDFLESKVLERNAAFNRKTDLRRIVDEA